MVHVDFNVLQITDQKHTPNQVDKSPMHCILLISEVYSKLPIVFQMHYFPILK